MFDLFNSGISIEKFAAFLDGNLSADEMRDISAVIHENESLHQFKNINSVVDDAIDAFSCSSIVLPKELQTLDFELPSLENLIGSSDSLEVKLHSQNLDNQSQDENMNQIEKPCLGQLSGEDIQQQYPDTCAIKAQQLILESHDFNVTEQELVEESLQKGWYVPNNGGVSSSDVGRLLNEHGMKVNRFEHATIDDIAAELAKGHQVIVGVDSGELWNPGKYETFEDFLNDHVADHALIVTGIQINPLTAEREIILTDPGTGEVAHTYTMQQFQDAWSDSYNFMITAE